MVTEAQKYVFVLEGGRGVYNGNVFKTLKVGGDGNLFLGAWDLITIFPLIVILPGSLLI